MENEKNGRWDDGTQAMGNRMMGQNGKWDGETKWDREIGSLIGQNGK